MVNAIEFCMNTTLNGFVDLIANAKSDWIAVRLFQDKTVISTENSNLLNINELHHFGYQFNYIWERSFN